MAQGRVALTFGFFACSVALCASPAFGDSGNRLRREQEEAPCQLGSGQMCEHSTTNFCSRQEGGTCMEWTVTDQWKYYCTPADSCV